ncbi:TlpA disulfide reductase family protein [uncultured Brachyspira sp.]|uniref:TlpA family protein disulfide reductase n=2 Tax=uncultured Brachyspira sp. TaxID=221953 RepID=UPI002638F648|nr:TlpA disulfide reductase family protein [uncultured Brachyspira sp.]
MKKLLLMMLLLSLFCVMTGCNKNQNSTSSSNAPVVSNGMEILNTERFKSVLQEHSGKVILVNFFGSWCPPCKAETPDFVQVYEKYKDKNKFVIIGIAVDQNQANVLQFVKDFGITYPVYQADTSLLEYFQINPIPTSFLFDKDGSLLDSMVGYMSRNIVEQIAQYGGE